MGSSLARFSKLAAAAGIVGLLLAGGTYALASSGGGRITACVTKKTGVLFVGKCAKHGKKLTWNVSGPAGPAGKTGSTGSAGAPGAPGAQGVQGPPGPQGPGASILTYDANASATPTMQTIGTALGITFTAECTIPATGEAATEVFVKTTDGSLISDVSDVKSDNGTESTLAERVDAPPGTITTPLMLFDVEANAAPSASDHQVEFVQLSPVPGFMIAHVNATTTSSPAAQTCHASVLSFPTGAAADAAARSTSGRSASVVSARRALPTL